MTINASESALLNASAEADLLIEFLNTRHGSRKRLRDTWPDRGALARWLRERGLLAADAEITEGDYRRVIAFREALRRVVREHTDSAAAATDSHEPEEAVAPGEMSSEEARATLDHFARHALLRLQFSGQREARLEPESGGVDGLLAQILGASYALMADSRWPRLKVCHNHPCSAAFYDTSKNLSRLWCDVGGCGARLRARAYRQAHKQ